VMNSDFYIAVGNPPGTIHEAFGHDTSSARSLRSYVLDACNNEWLREDTPDTLIRNGNRMIRAFGWINTTNHVVIHRSGNDIILNWSATGAPYYRITKSTTSEGTFTDFVGSTTDTTYQIQNIVPTQDRVFYIVKSSSAP
jgi:hypothetical protein